MTRRRENWLLILFVCLFLSVVAVALGLTLKHQPKKPAFIPPEIWRNIPRGLEDRRFSI